MMNNRETLGAALAWLRNHYELDRKIDKRVLKIIDEILMSDDGINTWLKIEDMEEFRKFIEHKKKEFKKEKKTKETVRDMERKINGEQ